MMAPGVYDIAEGRVQHARPSSPTPRRSSPTAAPAVPRPPPRSSGPSTCSRPRSAWTRSTCAAATCVPAFDEPVHDAGRHDVRHRRLRRRARSRARGGRLRRPARRAAASARRRRPDRSSASACRCTSRSPRARRRAREFANLEVHPRRQRDGLHGLVAARAGPRHRVRHDRARAATGIPMDRIDVVCGRHRPRRRAAKARWARGRCRSAASAVLPGRRDRGRARPSSIAADLLEAERRRHRARRRRRRVPRRRHAGGAATWAEVATRRHGARRVRVPVCAARRLRRPASTTFPFGAHVAVVEVDTETGRSTCVA